MALDVAQMSNEIALSIQNLISALVGLPIATISSPKTLERSCSSKLSLWGPANFCFGAALVLRSFQSCSWLQSYDHHYRATLNIGISWLFSCFNSRFYAPCRNQNRICKIGPKVFIIAFQCLQIGSMHKKFYKILMGFRRHWNPSYNPNSQHINSLFQVRWRNNH